jgi:hypothetical protein
MGTLRQILEQTSKSVDKVLLKISGKKKRKDEIARTNISDKTNSERVLPSRAPIVAFAFRCGGDGGNRKRAGSRHFLVFIHLSSILL